MECTQRCPYHALNLRTKASLLSGFHMIVYEEEEEDDHDDHEAPVDNGSYKSEHYRCAMLGERGRG